MLQLVNNWTRNKDLNLIPRTHIKMPDVLPHTYNLRTWEAETENAYISLTSQFSV